MIGGVNFQPGGGQGLDPQQAKPSQGSGVQEAIKVLSLRLPKVVGAQAAAPMALLGGSGAQGSRVDSVVNQVLSRIMPQGGQPMPVMGGNQSAPSQEAPAMPSWPWMPEQPKPQPWQAPQGFKPKVIIDNVLSQGDFSVGSDGKPMGGPGPMIDELPQGFKPQAPQPDFDLIGKLLGGFNFPSGGGQEQDQTPLF